MITIYTTIPTAGGLPIRLRFDTDSPHLAGFFSLNWQLPYSDQDGYDARIVARRHPAATYGLPEELDHARWYCPSSRQVWITGSEYYGNVKITVRGLCSELAEPDEMFVHGCALLLADRGVILSGTSGAGKTTLTAALRSANTGSFHIINDDWGPLSLATLNLVYTGEHRLHMKYPSVQVLAPALTPSPETHPSENFNGDASDPRARLLIGREEVFGTTSVANNGRLDLFVVVDRDTDQPLSLRPLTPEDFDRFERGSYSAFYGRTERFLNGSLFLTQLAQQRAIHSRLLTSVRCLVVNNVGSPAAAAALILQALA